MEPCTQENRIARMEGMINTIAAKVDGLATEFQLLKSKVEDVLVSVEEHDRALKGNNGTIGLIAKVTNALEVLSDLQEALRGRGEHPGLIATIDRLVKATEEWNDNKRWLARLVIGWLITTVLMILFEILK